MCLATVYIDNDGQLKEVMKDVSQIEPKDGGTVLTGLFGDEKFFAASIKSIDLVGGKTVLAMSGADAAPQFRDSHAV